jgi:trk system potassium uptake protein TrkA
VYCIIVGGGKVGFHLSRILQAQGHEVTVIEKDPGKLERLERELGEAAVQGDGARPSVLESAGCKRADVVVAVTGDDAVNLLISQIAAKTFGVQRTIARLNSPRNRRIFAALGVEGTVSSTAIIADLIGREVATRELHTLLSFKSGEITIVEIDLPAGAPVAGKSVRDIQLPEGALLVSVLHGDDVILPTGATVLAADDRLIALCSHATESALRAAVLGG